MFNKYIIPSHMGMIPNRRNERQKAPGELMVFEPCWVYSCYAIGRSLASEIEKSAFQP